MRFVMRFFIVFFTLISLCISLFADVSEIKTSSKQDKTIKRIELDDFKSLIQDSYRVLLLKDDLRTENNKEQFVQEIFNAYSSSYEHFSHKARIPDSNRILVSFPNDIESYFYEISSTQTTFNRIGRSNPVFDYYMYHVFLKDADMNLAMIIAPNAKNALVRNIKYSIDSMWSRNTDYTETEKDNVALLLQLFDYTYIEPSKRINEMGNEKHYTNASLSYYNVLLSFKAESSNQNNKLYLYLHSKIKKLFYGFESAKQIKETSYFDLNPKVIPDTKTTFKLPLHLREQHSDIMDKHWILAVSDKGDLSLEKEEFKAFSEDFRSKIDISDQKTTLFLHNTHQNDDLFVDSNKFFKDAREIPDTVFLTLPEGEKTAELTFYFISEDGTQYSSQSIILTVPEDKKESTSTK